jgi:hypothetical protein
MKILIVDDDKNRLSSLANHLISQNIAGRGEVIEVDCADAAKQEMKVSYFDVLILDVVLPKRSGESGDPKIGLALLGQLSRSAKLHKPEKIIGITAHLNDINTFKLEFDKYCLTVIEANPNLVGWRTNLVNSLSYTFNSKLARTISSNGIHALTIHGIRTFGAWQTRLKELVHRRISAVPFHSYKYGYFPTIAFFIPPFRNYEVTRLVKHLREIFESYDKNEFIIFSHSFGTYLITSALNRLSKEGNLPAITLVLSGSVLRRDFDWSSLQRSRVKIVNDCADGDYILWLSETLVFGVGMAGKSGFYGFQNQQMINRFFEGGHSTYFNGDTFMEKYWLPLFDTTQPILEVDARSPSTMMHEVLDKFAIAIGSFKRVIERLFNLICSNFLPLMIGLLCFSSSQHIN